MTTREMTKVRRPSQRRMSGLSPGSAGPGDLAVDNAALCSSPEERLPQKLTAFHSFGMSFCIVSYLYFVIGGYAYVYGGWGVMVWTWALGSLGSLAVTVSLAETASACPVNSGLYYYAARLAPRAYRASASYATAWMSLLGTLCSVCTLVSALVSFISSVVYLTTMDENGDNAYEVTPLQRAGIYCVLVLISALVNSFSIIVTAFLITFGTYWNGISFVALLGTLIAVAPSLQPVSFVFAQRFTPHNDITGIASPALVGLLALYAPINALYGFDAVIFMTEETDNAAQVMPRTMMAAIAAVGAMSWTSVIAFGFCVQSSDKLLDPDAAAGGSNVWLQITWDAYESRYNDGRGGLPLMVLVLVSSVVSLILWNTGVARKLHSMGRDGLVPASDWLAAINPVTHTPRRAVWVVHAIVMLAALLIPFREQLYFNMATGWCNIATYVSYLIPVCMRFFAPARLQPPPGRFDIGKRWRPWISGAAIVYILGCCVVLLLPFSLPVSLLYLNYSGPGLGVVVVLLSAAYCAPERLGGVRHWWRGPQGGRIAGIAYAMWD